MEISRKTDYAIRMLADLVVVGDDVVSVRRVADEHGVPYSFARSIQHDLVKAGLIESVRGSHGGMRLAIDPRKTTLRAVIEAVQGPIGIATCEVAGEDEGPCPFRAHCNFNPIWCEAERLLRDFFDSITLHQAAVEGRIPMLVAGSGFVAMTDEEREALG